MNPNVTTVFEVFRKCCYAIRRKVLIRRESKKDKEFHFQDWVRDRLEEAKGNFFNFEVGGRNSYPDFRIVQVPEGYEVKGLAYPGRENTYDANSQVPSGFHNGRTIFYIFGRYPKDPDGDSYPVLDLVICHGDFLNADREYTHANKSIKGFGTYGDIMIRDRKMYVAPTPYALVKGVAHAKTLILPHDFLPVPGDFKRVGELVRVEAEELIVGYSFDLRNNEIRPHIVPNPGAGTEHKFYAYRLQDDEDADKPVYMVDIKDIILEGEMEPHDNDEANEEY